MTQSKDSPVISKHQTKSDLNEARLLLAFRRLTDCRSNSNGMHQQSHLFEIERQVC